LIIRPARRFQLGATGSIAGFALIVLTILKTWWDSRLAFHQLEPSDQLVAAN